MTDVGDTLRPQTLEVGGRCMYKLYGTAHAWIAGNDAHHLRRIPLLWLWRGMHDLNFPLLMGPGDTLWIADGRRLTIGYGSPTCVFNNWIEIEEYLFRLEVQR